MWELHCGTDRFPVTSVIGRRVSGPPRAVEAAVRHLHVGEQVGPLELTEPFVRRDPPAPWRSHWADVGELCAVGVLRAQAPHRPIAVEVEVAAWSERAVELRVRPLARSPQRWRHGRLARYFALGHSAADALAARVSVERQVVVPDRDVYARGA